MDFFQHQQQARVSTRRLIVLFALAVVSLLIMTNLLVMFVFGFFNAEIERTSGSALMIEWQLVAAISAIVLAVILMGSLYKISRLSSGGAAVAEMMGGKLIMHGTSDPRQQVVLNVVEEMAIASGTPVPPVYLIDEAGINAFAAGFSPGDAVIGVTRGTVEMLTREQLQGVIAHEFSHIHNGDMRLNIRLIGVLHGILVIGIIGYYMMRSGTHSRKNGAAFAGLGLGLLVIGYAGTFFGNIIKAAVSRQREFLADASAVQFTRNPDSIAGALINIGASEYGSTLENPETSEISHCLFGAGMSSFYSGLFATHPPLEERIKRVKPSWDGKFIANKPEPSRTSEQQAPSSRRDKQREAMATAAVILAGAEQLAKTGQPQQQHLQAAAALLEKMPEAFLSAVRDPYGARAVVYVLLIDQHDQDVQTRQLSHLEYNADSGVYDTVVALLQQRQQLSVDMRLPLLELALPSLRQLSPPQYALFRRIVERLIDLDGRISFFEWVLHKLVFHHLQRVFSPTTISAYRYRTKNDLKQEIGLLLSVMAQLDSQNRRSAKQAFASAIATLEIGDIALVPEDGISFVKLDAALDALTLLVPLDKNAVLDACAKCLSIDGMITVEEAELYRAISEVLDCPAPLLLPDN